MYNRTWKRIIAGGLCTLIFCVTSYRGLVFAEETSKIESGIEISERDDSTEGDGGKLTPKEAEKNNIANSWRYKDGEIIRSEEVPSYTYRSRSVAPWTNINGKFYNTRGEVIEGVAAKGIDVSYAQGEINWSAVKNSDVDYAIIQCGYGMNQVGQDDKRYKYNADECTRLGIPFGVYLYSYADSVERAKSEAEHVLRLVKGYNLSYPIYYDLEEDKVREKVSKAGIAKIAKTFCDTIKAAGYEVGVYANTDWFTNYLTDSQFDNWLKWVAQHNYRCTYNGKYTMWQCTSKGRVNGINGYVDLNMDFGTTGPVIIERDGEKYAYSGNQQLYGQQKINGKWYYFNPDNLGRMITGWHTFDTKTVYYGTDGAMCKGEKKIDGKWYYFQPETGALQTGLVNIGTKRVYYSEDGTMYYGEKKINGKWYYFQPITGKMTIGWYDLGTKRVYYGSDGFMLYGEQKIDGNWYMLAEKSGAMITGWYDLETKTVYYDVDGAMCHGEKKLDDKWYCFDERTGAKIVGWHDLETKRVYYGVDGAMIYGKQWIDNNWYMFMEKSGALGIGWYTIGNESLYSDINGIMYFGEKKIDGRWHHFDEESGYMTTGFYDLPNKRVYYGLDGALLYGEQKINGKWYYFAEKTGAMVTGWYDLGKKIVYYDADGTMVYGEKEIDGTLYQFEEKTGALIN